MKAMFGIIRQPLLWIALFRLIALSQASAQDKVWGTPMEHVNLRWRDPADWTGLNCSSASFWLVFSARVSWLFYQWKVDNKPESRLIHNRPGPVRCENAWYRSVTSQQCAGPEKGDCG